MKKPKKSLGQNFLTDQNILKKIASQTKITNENIIEIGPGYGSLTDYIISKKPKKLILIEKDFEIFNYLKKKYITEKEIQIINSDALEYDFAQLNKFKVISNLPYNVSSKIIMRLLFHNKNIISIICMIQKELAIKFDYNKKKMNKYKFIIKLCANYAPLFEVSNNVFYPKPKVNSKVVEFKLKKHTYNKVKIFNFVNKIFSNKRKRLRNKIINKSLIENEILDKRAEELEFNELFKIYKSF